MNKQSVQGDGVAKVVGPYSAGTVQDGWLFISGQIPLDVVTGELVSGGVTEQTQQVLRNLKAVLIAAGFSIHDVMKTTVFMTDLAGFAEMNAVYQDFFESPYPARSTIQVAALPKGASVEIEAVAFRP